MGGAGRGSPEAVTLNWSKAKEALSEERVDRASWRHLEGVAY